MYHFSWRNILVSSPKFFKNFILKVTESNYIPIGKFVSKYDFPFQNIKFQNIDFQGQGQRNDFKCMIVYMLRKSLVTMHFKRVKIHDTFGFCCKLFNFPDKLESITFKTCTIFEKSRLHGISFFFFGLFYY